METLVKDVFGLIVGGDPAQARVLSMVCKVVRDTMRGLFKLTSRDVYRNLFEGCAVYTLTSKNFSATVNISETNNTIAVRFAADEDTELDVECEGGNFIIPREDGPGEPLDPRKLVGVQIGSQLCIALREDLPTILHFTGILVGCAFSLCGYYDNFTGLTVEECEDDEGPYYCMRSGQLHRVKVKPHKIRGGVFGLELI